MVNVAVIIGSKSDQELGEKAAKMLKDFDVDYDLQVLSAHRNPNRLAKYVKESPAKVFICIAGLAAALPGAVASHTIKPVIGVPKDVKLGGLDSLLSIVQMPTGVPVASVAIDGANNGSLLAIQILALSDKSLAKKFMAYREKRARA
ncbi:5-(carboxyamino)imidazole ribonucleotide mutase [Candidatus Bathyarchaeota archaeon]|jgi:5-(carboxyamino)imidazole ribonucleotide mutase|nr:5-(carboxyamino)imidazole ribonucleotide mutase [Candidatus Bathyarchaeota archaeon]MBT4320157.1 5-(carboxyamino)imidazole ribonucleotide mutase [Candidatus Bathyarchaeota archaeon]MBT6604764.1 5-(carboxyamino)imidazole ribonucleotide mutase [Candidatus Bathyarchaeota archaeon]MBT7188002.1 5-(carboxyamino)imidazole ribonucleotide mutase [Candidatus Bathyarchaeota archaeon]MBT7346284.1 5-(carboxyamino)imidazole ribonucleotide mutase [Candidatus Bathyarchaeota archaeon]